MIVDSSELAIYISYREWLLELAGDEAAAGCVRTYGTKSRIASYFRDITSGWHADRRRDLMRACIKRLFAGNYGCPEVPLSDLERLALADWDFLFDGLDLGSGPLRTPGRVGAEIRWGNGSRSMIDADKVPFVDRLLRWERGEFKIDKKLLKAAMKREMMPRFGKGNVYGAEWVFSSLLSDLCVVTTIDFGGRPPSQFRYDQKICRTVDGRQVALLHHGGMDALVGWQMTDWCYLTNADVSSAAELVASACAEFVDAAPGILERSGVRM